MHILLIVDGVLTGILCWESRFFLRYIPPRRDAIEKGLLSMGIRRGLYMYT